MSIGSEVQLIRLPPNLPQGDASLPTRAIFEKCLGHKFVIAKFNEVGWAELNIESITGHLGETIWVEPEYLVLLPETD
jgi:hypothetical protein